MYVEGDINKGEYFSDFNDSAMARFFSSVLDPKYFELDVDPDPGLKSFSY